MPDDTKKENRSASGDQDRQRQLVEWGWRSRNDCVEEQSPFLSSPSRRTSCRCSIRSVSVSMIDQRQAVMRDPSLPSLDILTSVGSVELQLPTLRGRSEFWRSAQLGAGPAGCSSQHARRCGACTSLSGDLRRRPWADVGHCLWLRNLKRPAASRRHYGQARPRYVHSSQPVQERGNPRARKILDFSLGAFDDLEARRVQGFAVQDDHKVPGPCRSVLGCQLCGELGTGECVADSHLCAPAGARPRPGVGFASAGQLRALP